MKKLKQTEKKLSLKKLQIVKITNLGKIIGGKEKTCMFPENASREQQGGVGGGGH